LPEPHEPEFPEFEARDNETTVADTAAVDQDSWQTYELDDLYVDDERVDEPEQEYEPEPEYEYEPEPQPEPEYYDNGRLTARAKGKGRASLGQPSHSRR
jgi:hypothetical protein